MLFLWNFVSLSSTLSSLSLVYCKAVFYRQALLLIIKHIYSSLIWNKMMSLLTFLSLIFVRDVGFITMEEKKQ